MLLVGAVFLTSLPLTADTVGAADGTEDNEAVDTTYYCYGNSPELVYPYDDLPSGVTITWAATALADGTAVTCTPSTGISTTLDLTDRSGIIRVTQTLTDGTRTEQITINVIPMHIGDKTYTVRFIDGAKIIDEEKITKQTVCAEGSKFFIIPSVAPTKSGYTFEGWYTSDSVKAESLDTKPVTDNIDFYAKWSSSGSGSSTTDVPVGDDIVVTFNVVTGIEYNLLVAGDHTVTFTVNAVGGFDMKMDTLKVTRGADEEPIYPSGGNYIVTNILEDTTITITCDRENPEPQPGPSEPFNGLEIPWWVFVPVGLIAFSLIMIGWYRK